jgi:protein-tyrosine phosphatase
MQQVKVLFVCMGNICRSPTAQGVFRSLVQKAGLDKQILTDSAGTHAYHIGEAPDPRSAQTAKRHHVMIDDLRARKVQKEDFDEFDYIIAMDQDNYHNLQTLSSSQHQEKLHLLMDFAPFLPYREVPDPYYGGPGGFDKVFDMIEAACKGLLEDICRQYHFKI